LGFEEADAGHHVLDLLRQAAAKEKPFDIAILDMQMSDTDGEALGRRIKTEPEVKHTELIMLSAAGQCGDAARLKKPEMDQSQKGYRSRHLRNCSHSTARMAAVYKWGGITSFQSPGYPNIRGLRQ
jgi:CheY-like chemotaxis protein